MKARRPSAAGKLQTAIERRRQARGLILLALVVLVVSLARFGVSRGFPEGWWRLW